MLEINARFGAQSLQFEYTAHISHMPHEIIDDQHLVLNFEIKRSFKVAKSRFLIQTGVVLKYAVAG